MRAKLAIAESLVVRGIEWPLEAGAPWWLLTNMPEAGDVFTWLDGVLVLAYIFAVAVLLGGLVWLGTLVAARLARIDWRRLALALVPLAGVGLFLGLSMMTATHLRAEGVPLGWLPVARGTLLSAGAAWSAWLGARMIVARRAGLARTAASLMCWAVPASAVVLAWVAVFFVW